MNQGLRITDAHAVTAAGTGLAAAQGAVATGLSAMRRHESLNLENDQAAMEPVHYAPVLPELIDEPREVALLRQLADDLQGVASQDGAEPVFLLLPGANAGYEHYQDPDAMNEVIGRALGVEATVTVVDGGAIPTLQRVSATMLHQGQGSAWLIGVDSRVAADRIQDLNDTHRVQRQSTTGLIPAEGAAEVRLELGTGDAHAPAIAGMGSAAPAASARERDRGVPLTTAITNASQQAGEDINGLAVHLSDDTGDQAADREWWQAVQTLWPSRVPEDQRRAMELGLLDRVEVAHNEPERYCPPATLGHVGAASLPLQLGLAARWRQWQQRWQPYGLSPGPAPTLISEHPFTGARSAVVVTG